MKNRPEGERGMRNSFMEKTMNTTCVHSCKELCNALEVAEHREREAIKEYQRYLDGCDYPDVREVLSELIKEKESGLRRLQGKRRVLTVKFNTIDQITESFR